MKLKNEKKNSKRKCSPILKKKNKQKKILERENGINIFRKQRAVQNERMYRRAGLLRDSSKLPFTKFGSFIYVDIVASQPKKIKKKPFMYRAPVSYVYYW